MTAWNTKQGAKGGCDGSLILAGELSRGENKGLDGIANYIQGMATKWSVGVADMIGNTSSLKPFSSYSQYYSFCRQPRHRHMPRRPTNQNLCRPQRLYNSSTRRSSP